jgi:hypothetical protein
MSFYEIPDPSGHWDIGTVAALDGLECVDCVFVSVASSLFRDRLGHWDICDTSRRVEGIG